MSGSSALPNETAVIPHLLRFREVLPVRGIPHVSLSYLRGSDDGGYRCRFGLTGWFRNSTGPWFSLVGAIFLFKSSISHGSTHSAAVQLVHSSLDIFGPNLTLVADLAATLACHACRPFWSFSGVGRRQPSSVERVIGKEPAKTSVCSSPPPSDLSLTVRALLRPLLRGS